MSQLTFLPVDLLKIVKIFKQLAWLNSPELGLHFGIKNINLGKKSLMLFMFAFGLFFSSCAVQDNFQNAIRYRIFFFCIFKYIFYMFRLREFQKWL